jgi:hypothetical protein
LPFVNYFALLTERLIIEQRCVLNIEEVSYPNSIYTPGYKFNVYRDGESRAITVQDHLNPELNFKDPVMWKYKDDTDRYYLFAHGKFIEINSDQSLNTESQWHKLY